MPATEESSSTSVSLLERLREYDRDAWYRLSRLYSPLVYRWCRRAELHHDEAADVAQEVFRAVAKGIVNFHRDRPGDRFRGWLWTITRNKLLDHFRHRTTHPSAVGGPDAYQRLLEIPDSTPDQADVDSGFDATSSLAHRALELVRDEFEPTTWQSFLRVTLGGQNPASVAEELGLTVGAVYTAKSRVLRRLRQEIDGLV